MDPQTERRPRGAGGRGRKDRVMPSTYLVTGGAGFIGSHLVGALLARGDQVTVLDDLSTGRTCNLDRMMGHPGFRFVQGSVLDEITMDELAREHANVVHLAAAV